MIKKMMTFQVILNLNHHLDKNRYLIPEESLKEIKANKIGKVLSNSKALKDKSKF